MKNSMYEPPNFKEEHPDIYYQLFGDTMIQVYINNEQVFDVISAATFSDRDKEYNPTWFDFVKFRDGSIRTGNIKISENGFEYLSGPASAMNVSIEECPLPPKECHLQLA